MSDSIRPAAIGFVFGAVAGIAIGGWYVSGMSKVDEPRSAEAPEVTGPTTPDDPADAAAPGLPTTPR